MERALIDLEASQLLESNHLCLKTSSDSGVRGLLPPLSCTVLIIISSRRRRTYTAYEVGVEHLHTESITEIAGNSDIRQLLENVIDQSPWQRTRPVSSTDPAMPQICPRILTPRRMIILELSLTGLCRGSSRPESRLSCTLSEDILNLALIPTTAKPLRWTASQYNTMIV